MQKGDRLWISNLYTATTISVKRIYNTTYEDSKFRKNNDKKEFVKYFLRIIDNYCRLICLKKDELNNQNNLLIIMDVSVKILII